MSFCHIYSIIIKIMLITNVAIDFSYYLSKQPNSTSTEELSATQNRTIATLSLVTHCFPCCFLIRIHTENRKSSRITRIVCFLRPFSFLFLCFLFLVTTVICSLWILLNFPLFSTNHSSQFISSVRDISFDFNILCVFDSSSSCHCNKFNHNCFGRQMSRII